MIAHRMLIKMAPNVPMTAGKLDVTRGPVPRLDGM
jgi:hypothetical protein